MKKKITSIISLAAMLLGLHNANCFAQNIAAGRYHSLFVCTGGTVNACGYDNHGQLGDGGLVDQFAPVQVSGLTGITAVAAGIYHSLFLKSDGTVWACGYNLHGELGDGTNNQHSTPIQVSGLSNIVAIAAGYYHSVFLRGDGTVWACGWNTYGQIGDGTTGVDRLLPVQVSGLTGIMALGTGGYHSLYLKNDNTAWSCGYNGFGQLGDGTNVAKSTPFQIATLSGIVHLAGGDNHSLFVKNDGTAWSCGYNNLYGQLGDGTNTNRYTPVPVTGLTGILKCATGTYNSMFVKNDGTVWTCGNNQSGQLGYASPGTTTCLQVTTLSGILTVAGGWNHSIFIQNTGAVYTCGQDGDGQLGDGSPASNKTIPVQALTTSCIILPVNLVSFSGRNMGGKNILEWKTGSEINNACFIVERSSDENNFEPVGKVNGAGNSIGEKNYSFTDEYPFPGTNYYRLKQVDYDGNFSYSKTISIKTNDKRHTINTYPVPSDKELNYEFYSERNVEAIITVLDVLGNIVSQTPVKTKHGMNKSQLEITGLSKGVYFLKMDNGMEQSQNIFIKQ